MKRSDIDWPELRGAIVIFTICLLLSASMLAGSFYFKSQMHKEYELNNANFRSVSNKYFAVDEEEKLIRKFYPLFIDLYNNGVIGKEQRLNWIEVLRNAGEEIKIPGMSYEIRTQETYKPGFKIKLRKYKLFRSVMNLNMQLLHEGDLFRLFEILDKNAHGSYNVSNCTMSSKGREINESAEGSNITVRCELTWHTIKLKSGKELKV